MKTTPQLLTEYGFKENNNVWYFINGVFLFEYWAPIEVLYIKNLKESNYNLRIEFISTERVKALVDSITNTEDSFFKNK